jgi:hypothetical protein
MIIVSSVINGLINNLNSIIKEESCSLILFEAGWAGEGEFCGTLVCSLIFGESQSGLVFEE